MGLIRICVCLCVYACMFLCVQVHASVPLSIRMCVHICEGQRTASAVIPQSTHPLCFEKRVSHWPGTHQKASGIRPSSAFCGFFSILLNCFCGINANRSMVTFPNVILKHPSRCCSLGTRHDSEHVLPLVALKEHSKAVEMTDVRVGTLSMAVYFKL